MAMLSGKSTKKTAARIATMAVLALGMLAFAGPAWAETYGNGARIEIPSQGPAAPYPSQI